MKIPPYINNKQYACLNMQTIYMTEEIKNNFQYYKRRKPQCIIRTISIWKATINTRLSWNYNQYKVSRNQILFSASNVDSFLWNRPCYCCWSCGIGQNNKKRRLSKYVWLSPIFAQLGHHQKKEPEKRLQKTKAITWLWLLWTCLNHLQYWTFA